MTHVPPPKNADFLNSLVRSPRRGVTRWRNSAEDRLYEWDGLHGELEVYNSRGRHLGVVDPNTGEFLTPAVKGRKIDV